MVAQHDSPLLPPEKDSDAQERHGNESTHATVPWFPTPMDGWNKGTESFAPRHEASTIELFFDLWFVANLATFTQYHAVTNRYTFWSYVAFFIVLWTSWFHVVCFDARFTSDSIWERASKTVHFCSFAAFALVGYKFAPVAMNVETATPHWIYHTLCFALLLSRAWMALQYIVTILCTIRTHRRLGLTLPLALNALLFTCVASVCGGLFGGFGNLDKNISGILIGLYLLLILEFVGSLSISIIWQKLSFQATHVGERLGLLGLIIIGEGVIGITKTITRTMGKNGPTYGASAQIFCIVLILVFMWILYFDKVPSYRFGVVQQQLWMALHLPFHLAILGVVEGAQQLAQARYIYYSTERLGRYVWYGCVKGHLDGEALATNLTRNIEYFRINESARGTLALEYVYRAINLLGNTTDVCSPANTTEMTNELSGIPLTFLDFFSRTIGAMVQAFDIDIPRETTEVRALNTALSSWRVVYMYFWSSIILLLICYTITSLLADRKECSWLSFRMYTSWAIYTRVTTIVLAVVMLVLGAVNQTFVMNYISSAWILPTVVLKLYFICLSDRASKIFRKRKEGKQKYKSLPDSGTRGGVEGQRSREAQGEERELGELRRRETNGYGYPSHC